MPNEQEAKNHGAFSNAEIRALVAAARKGDSGAFGHLYEIYAARVFRFLYARLDNRQDAEDLTEDVFIKVWQSLPGFRERGIPFSAFLFRVARNALTDHYRQARRRKGEVALDSAGLPAPEDELSDVLAHDLARKQVRKSMGRLRKDYRLVLELRFLASLTPDEAAEVMDKTPGAIRVLQHRALKALSKLVEEAQEDE